MLAFAKSSFQSYKLESKTQSVRGTSESVKINLNNGNFVAVNIY